ncbi:hypothetical protein [Brenneria salicis]|nr:hypothetical protein [Brenneria salicis]
MLFTGNYRPRRNDAVVLGGKSYIENRYQIFNGKPQIWIE